MGDRRSLQAEGMTCAGSWRQAKLGSLKIWREFNLAGTQSTRHGKARDEVGGIIRAYDKIINTCEDSEQWTEGRVTTLDSHFGNTTLPAV